MAKKKDKARAAELRKRAEKMLAEDPQAIRTMVPADIQKLIQELNIYQIELELQNEELRRTQLELQEVRDKYLNLYDFAPTGYFTLAHNSLIIDVNLAGSELLGSEKHRLIGTQFTSSISPDSQDAFYFHWREVLKTGIKGSCDLKMLKADGTPFHAQLISMAMPEKDGNINQFRTAVIDITERKQAEEKVRRSEDKYKFIFENSPALNLIIGVDGNIKDISTLGIERFGYSKDDIVGKSVLDFIVPEDVEKAIKQLEIDLKGEDTPPIEVRLYAKDKSVHTMLFPAEKAVLYEEGQIAGILISGADITERKQIEDALKTSEEQYRILVENANEGICLIQDGMIKFANPKAATISGYPLEKPIPFIELVHPDDRDMMTERYLERLKGVELPPVYSFRMVDKEGNIKWMELNSGMLTWHDKPAILVLLTDITERKQAEEALRKSEEKYRLLAENARDIIWTMNMNLQFTYMSPSVLQVRGYTAEEVMSQSVEEILTPSSLEVVMKVLEEELAIEGTEQKDLTRSRILEIEHTCKDGSTVWGEMIVTFLRDENGRPIGLIGISRDITERRRTERLLEDIFTTSTIGMYIVQDRKLQLVNPQFQKLTGYSQAKLVGMDPLDIVLPQDRDMVKKNAVNMLKGQQSSVYEFRYVNESGQVRWATESVVSIVYQEKQAALGSFIDTTESKKMGEQWLMTSKLAAVGELAAGVAHEINNPLTGVMGYAQLLMDKQDVSQDVKDDLQKIYEESQRAVKIVQNLLRFARRYKPGKEHVDINDLLERTLELESYKLRTSNISLTINLVPELPLILADSNQLQQVILNLITNAEQAIVRTKRKGKITVTTEKVKDYVRIAIADNGPGISPKHITKIFDPFFTTNEVGSGTGLGLSVSHGIITEHGGRIYAESELGKGTTFVIELPVAVDSQQSAGKSRQSAVKSRRPRQKATGNILIVDDEPSIRSILTRTLSNTGHQAQAVSNGKAALRKLAENVYDLLIVDLKMSGLSGRELYEIMKKSHPNMAKRVVFITGDVVTADTHDFLVSTGKPYLSKPFNRREIMDVIEKALGGM